MAKVMVNGKVFDLIPTDGRKSFYGKAKVVDNNGEKHYTATIRLLRKSVELENLQDFGTATQQQL